MDSIARWSWFASSHSVILTGVGNGAMIFEVTSYMERKGSGGSIESANIWSNGASLLNDQHILGPIIQMEANITICGVSGKP